MHLLPSLNVLNYIRIGTDSARLPDGLYRDGQSDGAAEPWGLCA